MAQESDNNLTHTHGGTKKEERKKKKEKKKKEKGGGGEGREKCIDLNKILKMTYILLVLPLVWFPQIYIPLSSHYLDSCNPHLQLRVQNSHGRMGFKGLFSVTFVVRLLATLHVLNHKHCVCQLASWTHIQRNKADGRVQPLRPHTDGVFHRQSCGHTVMWEDGAPQPNSAVTFRKIRTSVPVKCQCGSGVSRNCTPICLTCSSVMDPCFLPSSAHWWIWASSFASAENIPSRACSTLCSQAPALLPTTLPCKSIVWRTFNWSGIAGGRVPGCGPANAFPMSTSGGLSLPPLL